MDNNINNSLIKNVNQNEPFGVVEKPAFNKKPLYIGVVVLLVIIIGIWAVFLRDTDTNTVIRDPNTGQIIPDLGNGSNIPGTYDRDPLNPDQPNGQSGEYIDENAQAFFHIWSEPVAGYTVIDITKEISSFNTDTGTTTTTTVMEPVVYFVDKKNGNLYKTEGEDYAVKRVTNTTITNVFDAHFSNGAEFVAIRHLDNNGLLRTKVGRIPRTENGSLSMSETINGMVLDLDFAPESNLLAYIQEEADGFSSVYTYNPTSFLSTKILDLPIKGFNLSWVNENNIILQTKPSQSEEQQNFIIDISKKTIAPLSKNSGNALFSEGNKFITSNGGNLMFHPGPYEVGVNKNISTVVEKCTFTSSFALICAVPSGSINIDNWYKGLSQSSDYVYFIDENNVHSSFLFDISDISKSPVDIQKIMINPSNSVLGIKNKIDGSLWVVDFTKLNN